MPTFDVVSEIDNQEVKNAVDQTAREIGTRFDFKNTNSSIDLGDAEITLESNTEDRLDALRQVLEEKLVKRKVSLKVLDYQKVQEASGGSARQVAKLQAGINSEKARLAQVHQGRGTQGRVVVDTGRSSSRVGQEARRPTSGDRQVARTRLRHPAAVHELSRLTAGTGAQGLSGPRRAGI